MLIRKLHVLAIVLLFLSVSAGMAVGSPDTSQPPSVEEAFWKREWKTIDEFLKLDHAALSPRELTLGANALWLQKRWGEALALLQKIDEADFPSALVPYRDMMIVLALERTGEKQKAYERAQGLLNKVPEELGFYVAYALSRLSDDNETRRCWLETMLTKATNQAQTSQTLNELLGTTGDNLAYALQLLKFEPMNSQALSCLGKSPRPYGGPVANALGYAAYLRGEYAKAIPLFLEVPLDSADGLKSRYYRAVSLYRLERYEEALKLWEWLALNGKSYGESSVRRLGILAGQGEREKTLESLQRIADRGNSTVRPRALYSLYTLVPEEQKEFLKKELIDKYAMTEGTQAILWDDAWQAWKKGNTREALRIWEHFFSLSNGAMRERLLYWTARGYEKLEQKGKAEELFHTLISDYPLSIYSFLASPGGPSFTGETPSELEREKCELEEWGFVFYARLRLLKEGSSSAYYRAAILSEWLEDEPGAYSAASTLASALLKKNPLPKKGICFLYPRPYRGHVLQSAERFGVEPNLIWSVMKQESAFDADVNSWVGAIGLMQLMPATGKEEAKLLGMEKVDLWQPETNILLGASHLGRLQKRFRRLEWAIAAYNAGGGAVGRWIKEGEERPFDEWMEDIPYNETRNYVRKVMGNLFVYRMLY